MHEGNTKHSPSVFAVKTGVFEGPLELLLELIEKRKLLINDISLAQVTDEYMASVAIMEQNPLRETSQFVLLASTLLLIKSKSLLPILELTTDEEESIENLQERLRLYQIYRNAGKILASVFGKQILHSRSYTPDSTPIFSPDSYTTPDALARAAAEVIQNLPRKPIKPKVQVRKTVSLEDMISKLQTRIERQLKFGFNDFTGGSNERGTVIVGFLAVLEMVKQGKVMVRQAKKFDDIEIEREGNEVPRYM